MNWILPVDEMGSGMGRRELHSVQAILDGARTVLLDVRQSCNSGLNRLVKFIQPANQLRWKR
jgi:hypothetical protein